MLCANRGCVRPAALLRNSGTWLIARMTEPSGIARRAPYDGGKPAFSGPVGGQCAREPVPVMNEFLNFITYHPDTAEWYGPRPVTKGITSHVF